MKFPWANVALLLLLLVQFVSGYFGLVNGRSSRAWILWLHGIGAYALLVLLYWKSHIILDAIRRKRVWTRRRIGFLLMLALLLLTLLLGLLWTFTGPRYFLGFSVVSLHIYIAVPLMVLMGWHAWHMRFIWRLKETVSRRLFLGTAVSALAGLVLWRGIKWSNVQMALSGAARRFTGSYETGSFTGQFPVVSWIADNPPPQTVEHWTLRLDGAVQRALTFTYAEMSQRPQSAQTAVLDCTGGWYTTQIWQGVPLAELLAEAGVLLEAASVTVTAVTGYQRRFSLQEARRYLLALAVNNQPLSHSHGFPLRLVAVDQRGVNWVKWVSHIRVNHTSPYWQIPLPVQ